MTHFQHTPTYIGDRRVWVIERQVDGITLVDYVNKCGEDDGSTYYSVRHPHDCHSLNEHPAHTVEDAVAWYQRQLQAAI